MEAPFIPLLPRGKAPAAEDAPAPRLRTISPAPTAAAGPFQAVAAPPASTVPAATREACADKAPPTVTFKRDGDRVTQIRIQCSCGQLVVLDCEY